MTSAWWNHQRVQANHARLALERKRRRMEKLETFPKVRALPGVSHAGGEGGENATDSQQDQLICQLLLKSHFDRLSGCVFVIKLEGGSDGRALQRSQETGVRSQNQRRFETRTGIWIEMKRAVR